MEKKARSLRPRSTEAHVVVCVCLVALALGGCKRKHVPVDSIAELPYPSCDAGAAGDEVVARGRLRAGEFMAEKSVVETFEATKTSCGIVVFEGREEWALMAADIEVVYDADLTPLRVWKRMTIPGSKRADGNADIRRYELRTPEVQIKRKSPEGETKYEILKQGGRRAVPTGTKVGAVVGPGRGLITMWIRRARLKVGEKTHELVLDFREMVEMLEDATLERGDDRFEPSLGKTLRVYTFYGRETVFTDENDVVVGDLAGLRPSESLATPEPPPAPTFGPADPVNTP
jgi:hypothetical protein